MSMATELIALFAANSLGVSGTSLFRNTMPETTDVCGAVYETGGSAPSTGFGLPGIQHEMPSAQIRFRGVKNDSEGPRIKAQTAYRLCATVQAMTLSGTKYLMLRPLQAPFVLERDESERVTWCFNCLAEKELSATA